MKRKHAAVSASAAPASAASASKQAPKPQAQRGAQPAKGKQTQQQQPKRAGKAPMAFARPMAPLDASDSDEDADDDHEAAAHDRAHQAQIDADNDAADDGDALMDEDDDDEDDEGAESADEEQADEGVEDADEQDDADGSAREEEDDEDAEDDGEDAEDEDLEEEEEEDAGPSELDLPVQLVQATYSGVLYGLKSREPVRTLQRVQRKLHSKQGLDESDMLDDDDDEDEEEGAGSSAAAATPAAAAAAPVTSASPLSSFQLLFTSSAHIGSVKSLAASPDGKWLVSGGLDEVIRIYCTSKMMEHGSLVAHTGSVCCMEFYGNSFMLSGGMEGSLCVWNTKAWTMAKRFEGAHTGVEGFGSRGGVSAIAVHPSGRVALSVGLLDRQVKLWDLMRGVLASARKVDTPFHTVKWTPSGEKYVLVGEKRFEVYDTSNTLLRREDISDTKILAACCLSDDLIILGCEDKTVRIHSTHTGECVTQLTGHKARVRGLDCISMANQQHSSLSKSFFVGSASTDGQTMFWDLSDLVHSAADAASTASAPAPPAKAIHPLASSAHDQRVTLLRFLPQWKVRKDDADLLKPVQTQEAARRQQEVMEKKQRNLQQQAKQGKQQEAQGKNGSKSAAAPASASAKSKDSKTSAQPPMSKAQRLFEKKALAVQRAKRTLAKNSPHASINPNDAAQQLPSRKKAKVDFEEAPLAKSDDDEDDQDGGAKAPFAQQRAAADEDDEDDEPLPSRPTPQANSKPRLSAAQQAQSQAKAVPAAKDASAAGSKAKASTGASAAAAAKRPSAGAAVSDSEDDSDAHAGFSSGLPMFRPQLKQMQRKKLKSAKKIARDAERNKKLKAGR